MSTPAEELDRIEDAAAEWLAEREEGLSPARLREFDRWCRMDPRHAAAVARLEQACALLGDMPRVRAELQPVLEFPVGKPVTPEPAPKPRTAPWRAIAIGLAAAVAIAAVSWWQWPEAAPASGRYSTSSGGYERVVLADGSVVELNADSEVRVDFAPRERHVTLVAGEAHFTVAHDTARPFIVGAGHVAVRAVGTAFNVRLATSSVEVLVTEGKVGVAPMPPVAAGRESRENREAPLGSGATLLVASERLVIPDSVAAPLAKPGATPPVVEKISPELIRAALAWQERKLAFADTPLREVVAQFTRRNRLQLIIADPALAERPVGGTFAADNVEGFVRLLEGSPDFSVERRGEFEVVLRAAH